MKDQSKTHNRHSGHGPEHGHRHLIRSRFYRYLLVFFLTALIIIAVGLFVLWNYLADYQKCLPDNETAAVVTAFQTQDVNTILTYDHQLPAVLQKPAKLYQYLRGTYHPQQVYCYENKDSGDTKEYILSDDTKQLATLTLTRNATASFWGHHAYTVSAIALKPLHSYRITAPSDVTLLLNGQNIGQNYLTDTTQQTDAFEIAGLKVPSIVTYVIPDLNYVNSLTAEGCDVTKTAADTYLVSRKFTAAEKDAIRKFAETFAKAYTVFATKRDVSGRTVQSMIVQKTPLSQAVSAYKNDWGQVYDVDSYDGFAVKSIEKYGDHAYSCEVALSYNTLNSATKRQKTYDFDYTFYMTDQSGTFQVLDMKS